MTATVDNELNALLATHHFKCLHVPLQWLDTHHESRVRNLLPEEPGYSYAPHMVEKEQRVQRVRLPAVSLHRFEDAIISTRSSSVLLKDRVLVERVEGVDPARCDFSTGHILRHNTTHAQVGINGVVIDVPNGIFLGGNGSFNYYHLLVEILPRLQHVLSDPLFATYPLLVDESVEQIPNYRELIEIASGGHPYLTLRSKRAYRVGRLAYVNAANTVPFDFQADAFIELGDTLTRPSTIAFLRERFKRSISSRAANLPKRVFFSRRPGPRTYNQNEIRALLEQFGFVSVYMEDLSIADQVQLMSSADVVAGPGGAAWANLVFMREGTRALSWLPECSENSGVFSTLAKAAGVDLRYLGFSGGGRSPHSVRQLKYYLDPAEVRRAIEQMLDLDAVSFPPCALTDLASAMEAPAIDASAMDYISPEQRQVTAE